MVSNFFKYLLGFILALAILAGSGVAAALYFMNQSSKIPPKPIYANDEPEVRASAGFKPTASKSDTSTTSGGNAKQSNNQAESKPTAKPTPSDKEKAADKPKPLPPGAYKARVTWPQGLSLRSEPSSDASRAGSVGFKQKVIVIQESEDKAWQKVRLEDSDQEGWVRAGNTSKDDGEDNQQNDQNNKTDDNQQNR